MYWDLLFYYGSFLFDSTLEFCCLVVLVSISLSRQLPSFKRFVPYLTIYTVIDCLSSLFYQSNQLSVILDIVLFFVRYVKPIVFLYFIFGFNARRSVIFAYVIYAIIISIFTQTILFAVKITIHYNDNVSIGLLNWVDGLLNLFLLVLLWLAGKNMSTKNAMHSFFAIPIKTYILIICTLFCVAILQNNIFSHYAVSDFTGDVSKFTTIILTVLLVLLIVYLIITYNSKLSFEQTVTQLSRQIDAQIVHYKVLKIYDDQQRKFRHDYENMIFCLRVLLRANNVEEALNFIDEVEDTFDFEKPQFDSGNYIADALLRVKNIKANEYQTEIIFDGFIPSTRITNLDLCIILTNALDNAIEACQSIEGKKTIHIQSQIKNGFWFVTITNPVQQDVKIRHNSAATTKLNTALHGFGLPNIQRTVQKCGGKMHLACKDKQFTLSIALKLGTGND